MTKKMIKARCVSATIYANEHSRFILTHGKTYDVVDYGTGLFIIEGDEGSKYAFPQDRFEVISEPLAIKRDWVMSQLIIDRDIDFYTYAEADHCERMLRRCGVQEEKYWQNRLEAAQNVTIALIALKQSMGADIRAIGADIHNV